MQKPLLPALLFTLLVMAFGCGKSSDNNGPDGSNNATWVVNSYTDFTLKTDATSEFYGYSFELNDSNVMVVHLPGGTTQPAKWVLDNTTNSLAIGMENPFAPVDKLLGNWGITEKTDTKIKVKGANKYAPSPDQANVEFILVKQ